MTLDAGMRAVFFLLMGAAAPALQAQETRPVDPDAVALVGRWRLNVHRSHYGRGADARRQESLTCDLPAGRLRCTIRSVRHDGRALTGRFTAPLDSGTAPVTGMPNVDAVQLWRPAPSVVDATFTLRGEAVFGYRAYSSADKRSLVIVAVDPISRAPLTSVIVYDRR